MTASEQTRSYLSGTAATDEVDDFEAVAVFQQSPGPAVAGDYFAVQFDGDAVGLHVQGFDQGRQGKFGWRCRICEGALFSVDVKVHPSLNSRGFRGPTVRTISICVEFTSGAERNQVPRLRSG